MRPGDIDHDGSVDALAVLQRDALHPATRLADRGDLGVEAKPPARRLGGALGVVGGELGVADVARAGREDGTRDALARGDAERRVVAPANGPEVAGIHHRHVTD